MSRLVLKAARGDSAASLGSLLQCSSILTAKKFVLAFRGHFPCPSLCLLPFVLSLSTAEKSLAPSSRHLPFRYWSDPLCPLSAKEPQVPQLLLSREMLQSSQHLFPPDYVRGTKTDVPVSAGGF